MVNCAESSARRDIEKGSCLLEHNGGTIGSPEIRADDLAGSLYRVLLRREPDDEGRRNFVMALDTDPAGLDKLIENIILSPEFRGIALTHQRIAEAALELALPLLTGREPTKDVVDLLGERLVQQRASAVRR